MVSSFWLLPRVQKALAAVADEVKMVDTKCADVGKAVHCCVCMM